MILRKRREQERFIRFAVVGAIGAAIDIGIFNILSDRVETVTPWLAKRILANKKNGITISWLTRGKIMKRFLLAPLIKRKIYE